MLLLNQDWFGKGRIQTFSWGGGQMT